MVIFYYLCFMIIMLSCMCLAALWLPAGKMLTYLLFCLLCFLVFCHYPILSWVRCGISFYHILILVLPLILDFQPNSINQSK